MKFTKMHGIGNDYVYVNCFEETVEILPQWPDMSVTVTLVSVPTD